MHQINAKNLVKTAQENVIRRKKIGHNSDIRSKNFKIPLGQLSCVEDARNRGLGHFWRGNALEIYHFPWLSTVSREILLGFGQLFERHIMHAYYAYFP